MKVLGTIGNWFRRNILQKQDAKTIILDISDISDIIPKRIDIDLKLPQKRIIENYNKDKKTILIIDDSRGIVSIVEDYLAACGVNDDYNIITFFDTMAPFVMIRTLAELKKKGLKKIDYASIDIVLPGKFRTGDNSVKMDGVDVSIFLHEEFDCNNFVFYTGNIVNMYVEYIGEKATKFYNHFKKDIHDYIIFKTTQSEDDMLEDFCSLISCKKYVI